MGEAARWVVQAEFLIGLEGCSDNPKGNLSKRGGGRVRGPCGLAALPSALEG